MELHWQSQWHTRNFERLPARVALRVDGFQAAVFDVGVDLRGRDAGVAEHFLEGSDLGASGQHVRRKTVSQCVRTDAFSAADSLGVFLDDAPDRDP